MNSNSKNKFPSFSQWRKLPGLLNFKEKLTLSSLLLIFLGSGIFIVTTLYVQNTKAVPAKGGTVLEGVLGSPRFLNPVYADANDVDRDLAQLLFAGLAKYDEKGEIVLDLAKELAIDEGGKVYELTLKDDLKWSDGTKFSADDVVFTVTTVQDPRYKSPIRANWIGVTIEKVSEAKVRFTLQEPFAPFLERLTLKILPRHIWQEVSPENFALSIYNLQPVGMGPYRIREVNRDKTGVIKEISLGVNPRYPGQKPFIQSFVFKFFENSEDLGRAFERGDIHSFAAASLEDLKQSPFTRKTIQRFSIPRYFALFFNLGAANSEIKKKDIRRVLAGTLDKQTLVDALAKDYGNIVDSPILPNLFGFEMPELEQLSQEQVTAILKRNGYEKKDGRYLQIQSTGGIQHDLQVGSSGEEVKKLQECLAKDTAVYPEGTVSGTFGSKTRDAVNKFQEKYAEEILTPIGLKSGTGKVGAGTRDVLNRICFPESQTATPLKVTISTMDEYPLKQAAELIKEQWEQAGFSVELKLQNALELERDIIKPRNYETLLFGEILGLIPDPFPFWHSTQKRDPGLNLSQYENKEVDKLLEKARKEIDETTRKKDLGKVQDLVLQDLPALFLFDLSYVYITAPSIKGIEQGVIADPAQRYAAVEKWYINTRRAWK